MALEALASNELSNFIIYDTLTTTTPNYCHGSSETSFLLENSNSTDGIHNNPHFHGLGTGDFRQTSGRPPPLPLPPPSEIQPSIVASELPISGKVNKNSNYNFENRKKRRRRSRVCKNKEEAETQRMTHIAVERNRRKQMNEHLAVLRSMMPDSYIQRGDQASIVGGAIEFVKELEQLLQSLEAKKHQLEKEGGSERAHENTSNNNNNNNNNFLSPPFAEFFSYPQYLWCQNPCKYPVENRPAIADIEVTLIETHASMRILSRRRPKQLFKLVVGFQALLLTILHLNVTTLDPLVLYSFNAKVEEGCHLTSVDDIAGAVHHMLRIIEEEATLN
ncbi:transcription factor bHLH71-like [Telopea speciosissima]|uniref:transcription factor bHLH71-like n=1 Tax=Telopea speciosissima TaxID=54955 RepID=UPI001CC3BED2|nr:transcription factor bHLH71-like [Telopea speciosissima]